MCRENSLNQIDAALELLENAQCRDQLTFAQGQALAFIQAAYSAEHISEKEKLSAEATVRKTYRKQITGEGV